VHPRISDMMNYLSLWS